MGLFGFLYSKMSPVVRDTCKTSLRLYLVDLVLFIGFYSLEYVSRYLPILTKVGSQLAPPAWLCPPIVTLFAVTGPVTIACSISLRKTRPRLPEVRLLNRKVYSSKYDWLKWGIPEGRRVQHGSIWYKLGCEDTLSGSNLIR